MLIELMQGVGLQPRRMSSTKGGEFHSACPGCGGTDRFVVWPKSERYWCRQCKKSGDPIQFCRDFMGMSFQEAHSKVGGAVERLPMEPEHASVPLPSDAWKGKAGQFIKNCHQNLLSDSQACESLKARGLSQETIRQYSIGWNPTAAFVKREEWGLDKTITDGKEKKLWLPPGFVIPAFQESNLRKIKIRRADWKEGDNFGKYYIMPGSVDCISIFGDSSKETVVVVEAEFDAMLVAQEAGDLCCCIALGGAQKKPDASLHRWLDEKQLIVLSLDFDEAGKKEYAYWQSTYANLCAWPAPVGKSPAEAWKLGVDLKKWVSAGIQRVIGKE